MTYVLMNNFCPCFIYFLRNNKIIWIIPVIRGDGGYVLKVLITISIYNIDEYNFKCRALNSLYLNSFVSNLNIILTACKKDGGYREDIQLYQNLNTLTGKQYHSHSFMNYIFLLWDKFFDAIFMMAFITMAFLRYTFVIHVIKSKIYLHTNNTLNDFWKVYEIK